MKEENDDRKRKIILIVGVAALVLLIIIMLVISLSLNKAKNINASAEFIKLKAKSEDIIEEEYKLYTNYNDLIRDFDESKIKQTDFENNNVLVIKVYYDPCREKNITPTSYKINGDLINIKIEYEAECGGCAPENIYYALRITKSISPEVSTEYEATNDPKCDPTVAYKPIIYLYPEKQTEVKVVLKNDDLLTTTYPKYNNGWEVTANPDGTLIDKNNREYYGLYWEGINNTEIDTTKGFIVKGENTITFLENKLNELGLTDKEAEEFIIYWLPKLEKNKYNYIYFASTEEVNKYMPLDITPKPDSLIRVLMYYKPVAKKTKVEEQKLEKVTRKGFTVIEWGGTAIK